MFARPVTLETRLRTLDVVEIAVNAALGADVTAVITAPAPGGMPMPVAILPTAGTLVGRVAKISELPVINCPLNVTNDWAELLVVTAANWEP